MRRKVNLSGHMLRRDCLLRGVKGVGKKNTVGNDSLSHERTLFVIQAIDLLMWLEWGSPSLKFDYLISDILKIYSWLW